MTNTDLRFDLDAETKLPTVLLLGVFRGMRSRQQVRKVVFTVGVVGSGFTAFWSTSREPLHFLKSFGQSARWSASCSTIGPTSQRATNGGTPGV